WPSCLPQSAAVGREGSSEKCLESLGSDDVDVFLDAISTVSLNDVGTTPGVADLAGNRRKFVDQRLKLSDVVAIGRSHRDREGRTLCVDQHMVLGAFFPAIRGILASLLSATNRAHRAAIDDGATEIELVGSAKVLEQDLVKLVPNTDRLPVTQT